MAAKRGKGVAIIHFYGDQVKQKVLPFLAIAQSLNGQCQKMEKKIKCRQDQIKYGRYILAVYVLSVLNKILRHVDKRLK